MATGERHRTTRGGAAARVGGDDVAAALRGVARIAVRDEHRGLDELARRDGYALTRGAIAMLIELYRELPPRRREQPGTSDVSRY